MLAVPGPGEAAGTVEQVDQPQEVRGGCEAGVVDVATVLAEGRCAGPAEAAAGQFDDVVGARRPVGIHVRRKRCERSSRRVDPLLVKRDLGHRPGRDPANQLDQISPGWVLSYIGNEVP